MCGGGVYVARKTKRSGDWDREGHIRVHLNIEQKQFSQPAKEMTNTRPRGLRIWYTLLPLKGQCHEMDIFWGSKIYNQYALGRRWWFYQYKLFECCYEINYLIILKMLTKTLFIISYILIGRCSRAPSPRWLQLSQAAFDICFFRVNIAAVRSLKWVIINKKQTWLLFFQQQGINIFMNHQRIYRKYLFNIIDLQNNYSSYDPIPLSRQWTLLSLKHTVLIPHYRGYTAQLHLPLLFLVLWYSSRSLGD